LRPHRYWVRRAGTPQKFTLLNPARGIAGARLAMLISLCWIGGQEETKMATFIILVSFTEQGIRNVKDNLKRTEAFKEVAGKFGVSVKDVYWTLGQFDMLAAVDGPDDVSVTALTLAMSVMGNVRTQTLRAFEAKEMQLILDKVASTRVT
jgi:uncharacterized protein with GYD domain